MPNAQNGVDGSRFYMETIFYGLYFLTKTEFVTKFLKLGFSIQSFLHSPQNEDRIRLLLKKSEGPTDN